MKHDVLINKIKKIPNGRFFRLRYSTEPNVKAEYRNSNSRISITKFVDVTTRTGVSYGSIVLKRQEEQESGITIKNKEWIIPNKVFFNINTKESYFMIAPINKGSNLHTTYVLTKDNNTSIIDESEAKEYIIESYFRKTKKPLIQTIALKNIIDIW